MEVFGRALDGQHEVYSVVECERESIHFGVFADMARITPMTRSPTSRPHGKEISVSIQIREFFGNQCSTVMQSQALTQQSPQQVIN